MLGKFTGWFSALSLLGKVGVVTAASILTLGVAGSASHPSSNTTTPNTTAAPTPPPNNAPKAVQDLVVKTETATEAIPFETKTIDDTTLVVGVNQAKNEGVNGLKTKTWENTYTNGTKTNSKFIKEEITTAPVTKIIAHGTKVTQAPAQNCPNGTYVNSSGNVVCSPYSAPSAPAGATARCVDGTYSFSQHRQGTCSYHGGVAEWL